MGFKRVWPNVIVILLLFCFRSVDSEVGFRKALFFLRPLDAQSSMFPYGKEAEASLPALLGAETVGALGDVDLGEQINHAYLMLPPSGGKIHIPGPTRGSEIAFSTPIKFATNNKPVVLECDPGTTLRFKGTSSAAITIDTGILHRVPTGLSGCTLLGSGGASIGIDFTNVNGAENFLIRDSKIGSYGRPGSQFSTCVNISGGELVFMGTIQNSVIGGCGIGINGVFSAGQSMERLDLYGDLIFQNSVGLNIAGAADVYIFGGSLNDNGITAINCTTGLVHAFGVHFENAEGGTSQYFVGGCIAAFYGGEMLDDVTTGSQSQMLTSNGIPGQLIVDGVFVYTAGRTIPQFAKLSNTTYAFFKFFRSGRNLGRDYSSAGRTSVMDFNWQTSGITADSDGLLAVKGLSLNGGSGLRGESGSGSKVVTDAHPRFAGGISNNGTGFQHVRAKGCATLPISGATCQTTINWPTAFEGTDYTVSCSGDGVISGIPLNGGLREKTTSAVVFQTVGQTATSAQYGAIDCIAVHD